MCLSNDKMCCPEYSMIKKVRPLARIFRSGVTRPQLKKADPIYRAQQYDAWRKAVITKAHARCEAVDAGKRCNKAAPAHRMFADHIVELSDGGAPFDPANGQCLCGAHHTVKTIMIRAKRWGGG